MPKLKSHDNGTDGSSIISNHHCQKRHSHTQTENQAVNKQCFVLCQPQSLSLAPFGNINRAHLERLFQASQLGTAVLVELISISPLDGTVIIHWYLWLQDACVASKR